MKPPKIICIAGAPIITVAEMGAIAGIAYGLYHLLSPVGVAISAGLSAFTETHEAQTIGAGLFFLVFGAAIVMGLGMAGYALYLWSKFNKEHCQSFWTTHIEKEKPVPILGYVPKRKPVDWMCNVGGPLLVIVELAICGSVLYCVGSIFKAIGDTLKAEAAEHPAPMMTHEMFEQQIQNDIWWAHVGDYIAYTIAGLILLGIFVLWSKYNYKLCQRHWAKRLA